MALFLVIIIFFLLIIWDELHRIHITLSNINTTLISTYEIQYELECNKENKEE